MLLVLMMVLGLLRVDLLQLVVQELDHVVTPVLFTDKLLTQRPIQVDQWLPDLAKHTFEDLFKFRHDSALHDILELCLHDFLYLVTRNGWLSLEFLSGIHDWSSRSTCSSSVSTINACCLRLHLMRLS